jgi:hypothetical protein
VSLQSGQSQQFTATVTGTSDTAVTWTAILGSISSSGLYTAPTVTNQVSDTISAISVADSAEYASASVTVSSGTSSGAAYSHNPNSVTTKVLPSDVLSHCFGDTSNCSTGDAIAKCAMTDCGGLSETGSPSYMGTFQRSSPGNADIANAFYSSVSSDPWYSITAASPSGSKTVTFHAPNAASYPEGIEADMTVWDQSTGWVVSLYHYSGNPGTIYTLPAASRCGSIQGSPCAIGSGTYSTASNLLTAADNGYYPNSQNSIQLAPSAAMIREQELQNGAVNHAILIAVDCVNSSTPYVFPGISAGLGRCGSGGFGGQETSRPSGGTLLFCDYTPAQIAGFDLPAWQATILTAFCTYGGYVSTTGFVNTGIAVVSNQQLESSEAWRYYNPSVGCPSTTLCYNDPFWPWIQGQKALNGVFPMNGVAGCGSGTSGTDPSAYRCTGGFLTNIPRAIGPEGADAEENSCTAGLGCYPSGHIHVADSCIAKGYAGVSGGCS